MGVRNLTDSTHLGTHGFPTFVLYTVWIIAGLLILFLLLKSLRWVHRKYRVRQTWAMIKREREHNKRVFARAAETFNGQARQWQANLAALQSLQTHAEVPSESGLGPITWTFDNPAFADTEWQEVLRSGATALMQSEQVHEVEELYTDLKTLRASAATLVSAIESARQYAESHSLGSRSKGRAEEIESAHAVRAAHRQLGAEMQRFHQLHTDFVPVPSVDDYS